MVYARVATLAMSTLAFARLESHFLCPLSAGRMGSMSQSQPVKIFCFGTVPDGQGTNQCHHMRKS